MTGSDELTRAARPAFQEDIVSALQRSEEPGAAQIRQAIATAVRAPGTPKQTATAAQVTM